MALQITYKSILLLWLAVQVNCDPRLSEEDLALLDNKSYPTCFSKTLEDLTCFWEAPAEKSFEFLYEVHKEKESRCNIHQQETAEGKILYVCFFPPEDVFLFGGTHLSVVDKDTNTTVYDRHLDVEDSYLSYPPSNVLLQENGMVGQILVKWQVPREFNELQMQYEIRYTSKELQDTVTLNMKKCSRCEFTLLSLVPGETCTVQIRIKASMADTGGHWSNWSPPVTVMVPQTAADIELKCHTPDLHQVLCQWNEEQYGCADLHYRQSDRNIWGNWKTCDKTNASSTQCVLYGEEFTMFHVYLTAPFGALNRTFYMDVFRMNNAIITEPPGELKEEIGEGLCLSWRCPLPQISEHLVYEVRYQHQGKSKWKHFTLQNPSTSTCLDVQASGMYTIQIKAIPNGLLCKGNWSAWSKPLTKQLTSNTGLLFIACVPLALLIIAVALLALFSRYFRKLKQILWPPVPNLNDVLENFLKDLNGKHWEPSISIKQCDDESPGSVVEIMTEKETQVLKKTSWPPSSQNPLALDEQNLEMSQEYVTLKSGPDILLLTGNDYVYAMDASTDQLEESTCGYSSFCSDTLSASTASILNHSYLLADVENILTTTGHYTNLENVAVAKE